ncbi:ABC transporter ATP-binding protein [Pararhodospirillum oryzae]|uniref:ABC transporter n=1 Tax=Pararhodospirillum oryzae TaxID=478448 RepID=A0A512H7U5_9PROT|nr:ABC transporter ATP-binding protein [Pararhodospirillum oryzae]GEO81525.1 ABC transporter [Pararhodospirillum oryzae]
MSEVSLRVSGLSKDYLIYDQPEDRLKQMVLRWRRYYNPFSALRDVDLEVVRGETVGIVGRNGSGKTTLLEIIAGTMAPTRGSVEVFGRVAALLGLGAGFNPEFSGRDNVFLNAALLGLSTGAIENVFDQIAAFADIGPFIDRPVKTYSSGMYARLAFATAIHVDPDILIVDETLSVGDEAFQRKCFRRINQLKDSGCTILFVTHSAQTVVDLCDRVLLLDRGERLILGSPRLVVAYYQRLIHAPEDQVPALRGSIRALDGHPEAMALTRLSGRSDPMSDQPPAPLSEAEETSGSSAPKREERDEAFFSPHFCCESQIEAPASGVCVSDVHLETPDGRRVNHLTHEREYDVVYRVTFAHSLDRVRFGMQVRAVNGLILSDQVSHTQSEEGISVRQSGETIEVRFPIKAILFPGTYFLNAVVTALSPDLKSRLLYRLIDAHVFRILARPYLTAGGLLNTQAGRLPRVLDPQTVV